jgi:pimeloyl-ACP methyl ester carboxylesterase
MKNRSLLSILVFVSMTLALPGLPAAKTPDKDVTKVVVLAHGYMRTKYSMRFLEKEFELEGYRVINETYNSMGKSLEENADFLNDAIASETEKIDGDYEIYFITYSMGGLVTRCYLNKYRPTHAVRMVMIAPPNRGSAKAKFFSGFPILNGLLGPSGREMAAGDDYLTEVCGVPEIPFGIIAGGKGDADGYSDLLPGDDDRTVCVWNTYLKGTNDYLLLDHKHTFICYYRDVIDSTKNFLEKVAFIIHSTPPAWKE